MGSVDARAYWADGEGPIAVVELSPFLTGGKSNAMVAHYASQLASETALLEYRAGQSVLTTTRGPAPRRAAPRGPSARAGAAFVGGETVDLQSRGPPDEGGDLDGLVVGARRPNPR